MPELNNSSPEHCCRESRHGFYDHKETPPGHHCEEGRTWSPALTSNRLSSGSMNHSFLLLALISLLIAHCLHHHLVTGKHQPTSSQTEKAVTTQQVVTSFLVPGAHPLLGLTDPLPGGQWNYSRISAPWTPRVTQTRI